MSNKTASSSSSNNKNKTSGKLCLIYAIKPIKKNLNNETHRKNIEDMVINQNEAAISGIVPKIYYYNILKNGCYYFLMDVAKGKTLCELKNISDISDIQQLNLLNAYLNLGKYNFIQDDVNCENIFFDNK